MTEHALELSQACDFYLTIYVDRYALSLAGESLMAIVFCISHASPSNYCHVLQTCSIVYSGAQFMKVCF